MEIIEKNSAEENIKKEMDASYKALEITTNMGCKNDCIYCPQKLLLNNYYKDDKKAKSSMTLDDFKVVEKKLPPDVVANFGGMSEPFENNETVDMILHTHEKGRKIRVNTTLRGLSLLDIEKIKDLPFVCFCVHTPDKDYVHKQEVTDEYIEKVKLVKKFSNVSFMVIGTPHERIKEILGDNLIAPPIVLRGNSLDKSQLPANVEVTTEEPVNFDKKTKVICNRVLAMPSIRPTLVENLLMLPDGRVILCCIDYGLQHVVGNIYKESYEDILNSKAMKRIEDSMLCKNNNCLLCRNCEWAIEFDEKSWKNFIKNGTYCKPSPKESLFSIKKCNINGKKYKVITILGLQLKIPRR